MAPIPTKDNLSAILYSTNDLRLENRPISEPKENEVLVRMAVVGICGTDISLWKKGHLGDFVVKSPIVLGHEPTGVVVKCGGKVKNLKEGDRVTLEPGVPCGVCKFCKIGKYNICPNGHICGIPNEHGSLCRYKCHPAEHCFKLPENVSMEEGALTEPLAIAIHSCRRAKVTLGQSVLICGAGPIGTLNAIVARAMGASKIIMTDIVSDRLNQAKNLFDIEHTLLIDPKLTPEELACKVVENLGCAPDVVLECSGAESSIKMAIHAVKLAGTVAIVGMGLDEVSVPIVTVATKELDIMGVLCSPNCFPTAIAMLGSGMISAYIKKLMTHHFKLEETLEAYETMYNGNKNGAIKILIHC